MKWISSLERLSNLSNEHLAICFENLCTKSTLACIHTLEPLKFNKTIYFHLTRNNEKKVLHSTQLDALITFCSFVKRTHTHNESTKCIEQDGCC